MNLARFKISGKLPSLHVNVSDAKYKSLMRLIDACMPKFDDNVPDSTPIAGGNSSGGFQLPPLFALPDVEYNLDDDGNDGKVEKETSNGAQPVEAGDGIVDVCHLSHFRTKAKSQ